MSKEFLFTIYPLTSIMIFIFQISHQHLETFQIFFFKLCMYLHFFPPSLLDMLVFTQFSSMSLPLATNLNIIPILQFSFFTPPSKRLRESTLGLHSCFLINIQTCKAEREKKPTSRLSVNRLSVTRPPFHFRCERICFFFSIDCINI